MHRDDNSPSLQLEKQEQDGVWHLIANGARIGTYPTEAAFLAAAKACALEWVAAQGCDLDQEVTVTERRAKPETNRHSALIKLMRNPFKQ